MVILDIKDYIDEANRQLNDTNNYEQLDFDPTELHYWKNKIRNKQLKKWKPLDFKNSKQTLFYKRKLKHLSFTFFHKYLKLTIQEDL